MGPNNIQLDEGTLYIKEGEDWVPVEAIPETIEVAKEAFDVFKQTIAAAAETAMEYINRMIDVIVQAYLKACPNRRVAHLAIHGKSRRVRKKNWRRVFEIVMTAEEEEAKRC